MVTLVYWAWILISKDDQNKSERDGWSRESLCWMQQFIFFIYLFFLSGQGQHDYHQPGQGERQASTAGKQTSPTALLPNPRLGTDHQRQPINNLRAYLY